MKKICNKITSVFKTLKNKFLINKNFSFITFITNLSVKLGNIVLLIKTKIDSIKNKLINNNLIYKIKRYIYIIKIKFKKKFRNIKSSKVLTDNSARKSFLTLILVLILLTNSFAWLYDEYIGSGALLKVGQISHIVVEYDENGNILEGNGETTTLIYENNMSNITKNSKYIEIKNTGTLDMEFSLAFTLEGTIDTAGIMYYRLYDVTDEVLASNTDSINDTKMKSYASNNPISSSIETDTTIPISNMSLINNLVKIDTITKSQNTEQNSKFYRLDYGIYQTVNTSLYSGQSISVHMNVYSSQKGVITAENRSGQTWDVGSESQFREVLMSAINGDTIRLLNDINIEGTINITKRINLDTNDHNLTINGDLIYEFVNMGDLKIDTSGTGTLVVNNNFILNAPKAKVNILGSNKSYDIVVSKEMTVNAIQDKEIDGIFLENVRIVKNKSVLVPIDLTVMSNTRLTIGPNVDVGVVSAKEGSTNIEVVNNGNITQINFSKMNLLSSFTKPQIYIYNLGNIYGILGSTGVVLPENATPYLGPNNGNTLIIRGITSSDITVSGSIHFKNDDITDIEENISVVKVDTEENSYIVYIKDSIASIQSLLTDYFTKLNLTPSIQIARIKKLKIFTIHAQYIENEDFDYMRSDAMSSLEYLNLENSKVIDNTVVNRIKSNALRDKTTLKTVILPSGISEIGSYAFYNVSLGYIPSDMNESFNFVEIPSTITKIETNAFNASKYIKFKSVIVPVIEANAFSAIAKYFVIDGTIEEYQQLLPENRVYEIADLSDDRRYFVYETNEGIGISYVINNYLTGTSLGIPNVITIKGSNKKVTEIGTNSYREMNITSETGAGIVLPTTVTKIDAHAFYNLNVTSINVSNVIEIGKYAFYNTKLNNITANNLKIVKDHAFELSNIETLKIKNILEIGSYAFASSVNLHEVNVGTVKKIGSYAFYDCKQIAKFYFENNTSVLVNNQEKIDLEVGENALFSNWGYYIDGRLRVYVPDGKSSSQTEYVDLYKEMFSSNKNSIYVTGIEIGSYTHLAVPYSINEYTIREVEKENSEGIKIVGYEIISYQGADLTSNYIIPKTLTANSKTSNVISIGSYAYMNSIVTTNNSLILSNNNILNISSYAFYGLDISIIRANEVVTVGNYAFSNTKLKTAEFKKLNEIGEYALSNISTLVSLNIGKVYKINNNAISNDVNLEQLFISNINKNVILYGSPFSNIGTNTNERLRIYVPEQEIDYYQNLLLDYSEFIYAAGYIKGSYINAPIMYDIGEYSVREVTLDDKDGNTIRGFELVEYHGSNLTSSYQIPTEVTVSDTRLTATLNRNGTGTGNATTGWIAAYKVYVTNVGSENVNGWQLMIPKTGWWSSLEISTVPTGSIYSQDDNYLYLTNSSSNALIEPGETVSMTFSFKWTGDRNSDVTEIYARKSASSTVTLPVISIGKNAYKHTKSVDSTVININNSSLINLGSGCFENLTGIKQVTMSGVTKIDSKAFKSSSITIGTFTSVKSVSSYAFNSNSRLYKLDLGKVNKLESNAISAAPRLLQLLFDVDTTNPNLYFDSNSINNVGTASNDRMRFYVKNLSNTDGERYVDIYKASFKEEYKSYFFAYDTLMGSYIPAGLDETIDIGEYTIREVSLKNSSNQTVSGYEFVEYHGSDITRDYQFPSEITLSDSKLSATVTMGNAWGEVGNRTHEFTVRITNNGSVAIGNWRVTLDISSGGEAYSVSSWGGSSTIDTDRLTIINDVYNGTINPGGSASATVQLNHYNVNLTPIVKVVKENTLGADALPVISLGPNSFKHTKVTTGSYFDIESDQILKIDDSAFENNPGIRRVISNNVIIIGNNAFKNASILHYASFEKLVTAGNYAFNNTTNLAYLNLGTINSIADGLLAGTVKMTQLYINNTNISSVNSNMGMTIGLNSFTNMGSLIGERLRIYVPAGSVSDLRYVDAYKNTLPENLKDYIYEKGTILNSFTLDTSGLDIGQFSVIKTTVNGTTGFKIVEYHGENINSSFTIPTNLTVGSETYSVISVGEYAFAHVLVDDGYDWNLSLNSTIKSIDKYAFYKRKIKTLTSNNLTYIGKYAFAESSTLVSVILRDIKKIDEYAFYRNINMTTVNLGSLVEEIGNFAFYNSWAENNFNTFYINTLNPPIIYENTLPSRYWEDETPDPTIYVPYASISKYNSANYFKEYPIESIGSIYNNRYIYKMIDTNKIEITGYIANETGSLVIPDNFTINYINYNVVSITSDAFDSAARLESITIPRYVVSVGTGFLENNNSIQNIYVSTYNNYLSSVSGVLYDKNGQTLIRYPNGRTDISYSTGTTTRVIASGSFTNNLNLKTLIFNANLLAISDNSFNGSTSMNRFQFLGTTPPYLTGYSTFPLNADLNITYSSGSSTAYNSNGFYNWYLNYLISN